MMYIALAVIGLGAILIVNPRWTLKQQVVFVLSALGVGILLVSGISMWSESSEIIAKGGRIDQTRDGVGDRLVRRDGSRHGREIFV